MTGQFGCSPKLKSFYNFFFLPQLKGCVKASKLGWWMWLSGWGPVLTIPGVTLLQDGIQYLGSLLRNCPNEYKIITLKGRLQSWCYSTAFPNDQVWLKASITHANLNVLLFCLNTILVDFLINTDTVFLCQK